MVELWKTKKHRIKDGKETDLHGSEGWLVEDEMRITRVKAAKMC